MSYKVVRCNGLIVAFGPDDEHYDPTLGPDDVMSLEEEEPTLEPSILEKRKDMVCLRWQAKAALLQAGLLDAVERQFANATPLQQLAWNEVENFHRLSPMLTSMGAALGLTDSQLDDLFTVATGLQV